MENKIEDNIEFSKAKLEKIVAERQAESDTWLELKKIQHEINSNKEYKNGNLAAFALNDLIKKHSDKVTELDQNIEELEVDLKIIESNLIVYQVEELKTVVVKTYGSTVGEAVSKKLDEILDETKNNLADLTIRLKQLVK